MCKMLFLFSFASCLALSIATGAEFTSTNEEETLIQVLQLDQGLDKRTPPAQDLR